MPFVNLTRVKILSGDSAHLSARKIALIMFFIFCLLLGASNLGAFPVHFEVQGSLGVSSFTPCGTPAVAPCGPDPIHAGGSKFAISGAIDTTSTFLNCGTNCNSYTVPTTKLSLGGLTLTLTQVPINVTANTGGNPDTLSMSSAPLGIPVSATVGLPAGTFLTPALGGFGLVSIVPGAPPYTFGSTLTYGQGANKTALTITGTVDCINLLYSFSGSAFDGGFPRSSLTEVKLGTFVGTTFGSSISSLASTLFAVAANGTFSKLHAFNSPVEGNSANGKMVQPLNGLLYGVTATGGPGGQGTIYTWDLKNKVMNVANSTLPLPISLIEGADALLYGVTSAAANNVFFKMTAAGAVTPLHTFNNATEGIPSGPLVQANDFNFYGETSTGGANGNGMIFCVTKTGVDCATKGTTLTPVYSFTNQADGTSPAGGLVQAIDGRLYGVAAGGTGGAGVVFKVTLAGSFSTVHSFSGVDGSTPLGGLIQATDANLYGTTSAGGALNSGTVFRVCLPVVHSCPAVPVTSVHDFGGSDGSQPQVPGPSLTEGSDGRLYGTASSGTSTAGSVFSLQLGLPRPKPTIVRFSPSAGPVGTAVLISGRNLLGVTNATVNGISTAFYVAGATDVWVVVPSTATGTGTIVLTTPYGTAVSPSTFTVQ